MNTQKTGLILEGGGMRGIFTAGILDELMEQRITFPCAVGVSAGAAFGCNFKSGQIGRVLRYNLRFCRDPRYCGIRSLLLTGDLFGASFCYRDIPDRLDVFDRNAYEYNPMRFYVVCTDLLTGQAVYHLCDRADKDDFEWIRGSSSMPLVSRPVRVGGRVLLDGGIADSIPLRFAMEQGYERNVVILTQPRSYVKRKNRLLPLFRLGLRHYPLTVRAIEDRPHVYNESRELVFEQERQGNAFVFCPEDPLPIGRVEHDPEIILTVYLMGRQQARERIEELRGFLSPAQS